ncbi:MAG: dihydrofolate reductase family protein [Solirubrobacterales bacterium]
MGRIVASEVVTLDMVIEDPGGGGDFEHGGWVLGIDQGEDGRQIKLEEIFLAEALLMGRVTYEALVSYWPYASDDLGFAERINTMPKYVVSSTLEEPEWENTTVLHGDVVPQTLMLRDQLEGDIVIPGSAELVRTLFDEELLDQLRMMLYPVFLGTGKQLFACDADPKPVRLTRKDRVGDAICYFVFEPREVDAG